ncbi:MAG: hypothetical protein FWD56_01260, partial [Bacteroidales bacterium]|nr:hypothetical protein [Bacteroidales bacterium]
DTLFERVNVPDGPPLFTGKPIIYHLDDYTRFPTMQDIVIEFVSGTRLRRANNQSLLQIIVESDFSRGYTEQNALVLIDGIAIFDHERLFKYDLLKAKTVSIYHKSFRIGSQTFDGLAALHTYKGTYQDVTLGKNSVILDFDGVLYPTRFTGREVVEMGYLPDVCSLLYWDPLIHLPQDGVQEISIKTPSKPGTYTVEIEGTLSDGRPVLFKEIVAIIAQ